MFGIRREYASELIGKIYSELKTAECFHLKIYKIKENVYHSKNS